MVFGSGLVAMQSNSSVNFCFVLVVAVVCSAARELRVMRTV